MIVFASISTEASYKQGTCPMNNDGTACGYGILIGVIGFLGCIAFLILDARFENFSSIKIRKRVVVADMVFSCNCGQIFFFFLKFKLFKLRGL